MWLSAKNLRTFLRTHPKPGNLTQKQRVLRQYKQVLYMLSIHAGGFRQHYYEDAGEARFYFEKYRHLNDPEEIERRIQIGERWCVKNWHASMYRIPYTEDGSKHQRNEAVPEEYLDYNRFLDQEMVAIELSEWTGDEERDVVDEHVNWKHQF